jgi:hypothetical protein
MDPKIAGSMHFDDEEVGKDRVETYFVPDRQTGYALMSRGKPRLRYLLGGGTNAF